MTTGGWDEEEADDFLDLHEEEHSPEDDGTEVQLFLELPPTHTIAIVSSIMLVGFVLNATILRCYWRSTTTTSVYIRVLAVYDICALLALAFNKSLLVFEALHHEVSYKVSQAISATFANFYLVGPLFLAMDRMLVVAFPLKHKQYKGKMRDFKTLIVTCNSVLMLMACIFITGLDYDNVWTKTIFAVVSTSLLLQFVACIVFYTIIVVKIKMAERKMAQHRHNSTR